MSEETQGQTETSLSDAERIAALEAEIAALKDAELRALAEMENTRKRLEKAALEARLYAIDKFARDILPIADNIDRALDAPDGDPAALRTGVSMTRDTLIEVFARHGLKRIGAKGDKFDPNLHQAISQIPGAGPPGTIADVAQVGYVLADRTIRAALVIVSAGEAPGPAGSGEAGANLDVKV